MEASHDPYVRDLSPWISAAACVVALFILCAAAPRKAEEPVPALCRALVKHTPDADVTYQPGVDVEGKPVAPADLPGQTSLQIADKVQIPLTVSLAKVIGVNPNSYPYNQFGAGTEMPLGMLTIQGDKILLNDQPLSDTQQDNLAVLCMKPTH